MILELRPRGSLKLDLAAPPLPPAGLGQYGLRGNLQRVLVGQVFLVGVETLLERCFFPGISYYFHYSYVSSHSCEIRM